jgi:3-hydroxyacyl-CoA dehydrogenase
MFSPKRAARSLWLTRINSAPQRRCGRSLRADKLQNENRLAAERAEHIRTAVSVSDSVDALPNGLDLIVEAVPEKLALKLSILAAAERREPVLLASNTSALSISLIAEPLRRRRKVPPHGRIPE